MIRARIVAGLIAALAASCAAPEPLRWDFPGQGALLLSATGAAPTTEEDRLSLTLSSGLQLVAQRARVDDRLPSGERRDVASVAEALVTRVELGETEGELTASPCSILGRPASCVTGWITHEGERRVREGAVFEVGEHIVWLDVSGSEERAADVREAALAIQRSLEWRPS